MAQTLLSSIDAYPNSPPVIPIKCSYYKQYDTKHAFQINRKINHPSINTVVLLCSYMCFFHRNLGVFVAMTLRGGSQQVVKHNPVRKH